MQKIICTSFLIILINNALAQYAYTIGPTLPTASPQVSKQQLVNYLLSNFNQASLNERIEVLAAAIQQLPSKRNRRVCLADVLKNSALQSLLAAASVCGDASLRTSEYASPLQSYALPSYATQSRNLAIAAPNELNYALPRQNLVVANEQLQGLPGYATHVPRNLVVANDQLSNFAPFPCQNIGLTASSEAPLVANRELLSALFPRELLSSMVAGDTLNRMRY